MRFRAVCDRKLEGDWVLDHDRLAGKYCGAEHNECNLNYKIPKHIPVVFHLAGYDANLFIKNLIKSTAFRPMIRNTFHLKKQ